MSSLRLIQGGRAAEGLPGLLVEGAAEIATLAGGLRRGSAQDDPALAGAPGADEATADGGQVIACWEGRILAVGPRHELERALEGGGYPITRFARLDAQGGTVTPGLVDPHTHLLFAGSREDELVMRQRGAAYLEILEAGGGILSTVAATRAATVEALEEHGRRWLGEMLGHGTTTIEAKSGYGLDLATELRLLDVAHRLGASGPIDVLPTWLGAHAVPAEFRARPEGAEAYRLGLLSFQRLQAGSPASSSSELRLDALLGGRLTQVPSVGSIPVPPGGADLSGYDPTPFTASGCPFSAFQPWVRLQIVAHDASSGAVLDIYSTSGSPTYQSGMSPEVWWNLRDGRHSWTSDGAAAWAGPVVLQGAEGVLTLVPQALVDGEPRGQAAQP